MINKYYRYGLLLFLFIFVIIIYLPGINGALYYDDLRPLSALSKVSDINTALIYIFSETSGPLGRSVSMLTFLFNVTDWPTANSEGDISAFFRFNIVLHAINGVVVFGLSYFIALLYRGQQNSNYWLALGTSALWLVLPIHVSSSLIAIQRMTGLSALFVFAGLLLYLYGLHKQSLNINTKNNDGLRLQITGLMLFTLLAMFSKENGILLPVFVLVLELTLLNKVKGIDYRRNIRVGACALALVIIFAYLAYYSFNHNSIFSGRNFTLLERVTTQPQILLEYIRLAFIPDSTAFTPYHDNYPHVKDFLDSNLAIFSTILFITTLIGSIILRHRSPLFSFAVLWFITAHLLESSVINLELYFEHRNYVALFGPCLAIVFALIKIPRQYYRLSLALLFTYWLYLAFNLSMTTKLWGEPFNAAHYWFLKQQGSERASADLAYKYFNRQEPEKALQVIEQQVSVCSDCINSRAQAMLFSCFTNKNQQTLEHYQQLITLAPQSIRANSVAKTLAQIFQLITDKRCTTLSKNELKQLNIDLLQKLPSSPYNKKLPFIQNLYTIALDERDRKEAIRLLFLAWEQQEDNSIANELVSMLIASGKYSQAHNFIINNACPAVNLNPILARHEVKQCKELTDKVTKALSKQKTVR